MSDTLPPPSLLRQLKWRYAVKKFDAGRKIPADVWGALEETLVLTPSSFGLQPWKFFVVDNPELRKRLQPVAWNQAQITEAARLVVFAVKKDLNAADVRRFIERTAAVRGVPADSLSAYQKMMEGTLAARSPQAIHDWSARQAYIALGNFMTAAAVLGVDACPMEGFDPAKFDEILGLPQKGYAAVVAATAGYRAADDKYAQAPKVRFPKEDVVEQVR
jgi:nitroreductase